MIVDIINVLGKGMTLNQKKIVATNNQIEIKNKKKNKNLRTLHSFSI